jgi:hypothetical protein
LKKEIENQRTSISDQTNEEHATDLMRLLTQHIHRQALEDYESEQLVKRRMDMRASYLAIVISAAALIVSVGAAIYASAN